VLLLALERLRDAIVNRVARGLVTQLSGSAGLQLLVEVAHDMHSPLTSILFLAETLLRGESGPVTDLQRRQLGLVCTAALGLSSVGRDIVDLERSDLLLEPTPVAFSVTSVLESVRDIVRPIAEVKGLSVRVEPPALDERLGHPVALRRVLLNLTTNALKFTERGSVELCTREAKPGWIEFAVRDTGRGIEPETMPTLFEPVRQVPRAAHGHQVRGTWLFSNTGLGLAICRKLTEAMGSEMRVETQLGRGTRFYFELQLPLAPTRRNSGGETQRQATPAA
jgi:signal transduction histidine kinase